MVPASATTALTFAIEVASTRMARDYGNLTPGLPIPARQIAPALTGGGWADSFPASFRPESFEDLMPVSIRLTRGGSKKVPFYRVVAADRRSPRDGRFIEQLGVYDPLRDPVEFRVDQERLDHWIKNGAVPSQTVGELLRRQRQAAATAKA